ncbi:NAD-dependent epimerase/dehydratase family protein [Mycolicibacterium sp. CH28]|uniref:AMP-binding protein n=1 Tax=Mycolicibacterium sp. CH28 TaxID=2512237 RepID=UPI001081766D|nr:AMP-binding protein [Mycolicibacterium sp. CH28]TGD84433.1 NAD-dependent epimerase/dehydratase family protein [Mycolicibacterium sp. CH28]
MTSPGPTQPDAIALSRSQQNIYNGVLQDSDPALYLVARRYRLRPLALPALMAALTATIRKNPIQLCVLAAPADGDYPDLVRQLSAEDIVAAHHHGRGGSGDGADVLQHAWVRSILGTPLVRYVVHTDASGNVCGLDAFTHHILLDGGATGIIEADLGEYLSAAQLPDMPCVKAGLARLAAAHRREADKVSEAHRRLTAGVQGELSEDALHGGYGQISGEAPGTAARGVLRESVRIDGPVYDALVALGEAERVPLNVLVAAAVVAVDASVRQSTVSLLIHAADNRFGEPDLDVATCLVNSVAQPARFAPFASVQDVVRNLDRGYVRAIRRKWLREEHYRRMYLAINRATHVEALTLNFLREPCALSLRPHLSEIPVTTAIGPVESTAVAGVLDEQQRFLDIAIWDRADRPTPARGFANRIAAALEAMPTAWHQPIATIVDEWFGIDPDGARYRVDPTIPLAPRPAPPAWFVDTSGTVVGRLRRRQHVDGWIVWLLRNGVAPGDVLVFTDDGSDRTVDLLIAVHLAGCGYSACDAADQIPARAESIAAQVDNIAVHKIDVAAWTPAEDLDGESQELVARRLDAVARDPQLAAKAAYVMPTSGSTGPPKLVPVTHGALALFCAAVRTAYGWGPDDTVLQSAPLTSDISVEEVFASALCGARLVRSAAMQSGDLAGLARDIVAREVTVVDLPTAVWHLLSDDSQAIADIRRSRLRQVIVGGEAIRSGAVDRWVDSVGSQEISLISTYGPTEATVVATYLPIVSGGTVTDPGARLRLGRPMVPDTVFVAFGEVVIAGDLVAAGYLGTDSPNFGVVTVGTAGPRRAFATADRVFLDGDGAPVLAGRRDAIVKIAGRRVDTAEIAKRVGAESGVTDVAVERHNGGLGVWFETHRTRSGIEDVAVATRIRAILGGMGVPSFAVMGAVSIPRKPNGKIDSDGLQAATLFADAARGDHGVDPRALGLAQLWSGQLGRAIRPDSSLLDEGVGSLDLIKILPDTRAYLARQLSILDLISADTAANLVDDTRTAFTWTDHATAAEIEHDLARLPQQRPGDGQGDYRCPTGHRAGPIVVLGGSGILGTGFAEAVLDSRRSGTLPADVVVVTRSTLPERDPWIALRDTAGVRIEVMSSGFGRAELDRLLRDTDAATVVNCIGNTNVLVPYGDLRIANVDLVEATAQACASHGTRFVHLSTFVVNSDVTESRVTDPRGGVYPYAASKAVAELVVARSPAELDFTIVRLPRVLGQPEQMADSADILTAVADACVALRAYPAITLTEEVTTGRAVGAAVLGLLPEAGGPAQLGCGITVVRGQSVTYAEFLTEYGRDELAAADWKELLDHSDWARRNPHRWAAIDAWMTLGMRLGTRTYSEYLADFPTVELGTESVVELATTPEPLRDILTAEYAYRMAAHALISEESQ